MRLQKKTLLVMSIGLCALLFWTLVPFGSAPDLNNALFSIVGSVIASIVFIFGLQLMKPALEFEPFYRTERDADQRPVLHVFRISNATDAGAMALRAELCLVLQLRVRRWFGTEAVKEKLALIPLHKADLFYLDKPQRGERGSSFAFITDYPLEQEWSLCRQLHPPGTEIVDEGRTVVIGETLLRLVVFAQHAVSGLGRLQSFEYSPQFSFDAGDPGPLPQRAVSGRPISVRQEAAIQGEALITVRFILEEGAPGAGATHWSLILRQTPTSGYWRDAAGVALWLEAALRAQRPVACTFIAPPGAPASKAEYECLSVDALGRTFSR